MEYVRAREGLHLSWQSGAYGQLGSSGAECRRFEPVQTLCGSCISYQVTSFVQSVRHAERDTP